MENNIENKIISRLPYLGSFLFVDEISFIDENKVVGYYTFKKDAFFYNSHFSHVPITPGVILIEMIGQIGMVCHLIYLNKLHETNSPFHPILSNVEASFLKQVSINDKLKVISNKIYYRKGVLKSKLELYNSQNELCAFCTAQLQIVLD